MTETTAPEPETPACLCDTNGCPVHDDTAVTCDTCPTYVTIPGYDAKAHEVRNPGHRVAPSNPRIAELEADVRALGGDPDRMVDPRDHETAVLAMHVEMRAAADNWDRVVLNDACAVAERHMLRMAQGATGGTESGTGSADTIRQLGDALRERDLRITELLSERPAPELREVPAGEARPLVDRETGRDGDLVTITGSLRTTGGAGIGILPLTGAYHDWSVDGWRLQLSRPVSPLPDQPGAVIRCHVKGFRRDCVAELQPDGRCWLVTGDESHWYSEDLELVEVLYLPAGAGVDEEATL